MGADAPPVALENTGFHQFKHEWHWDHPFAHANSEGLYTTWILQAVAYNLFVANELHAALLVSPAHALPYLAAG